MFYDRKKLLECRYVIAPNDDGVDVIRVIEDDESSSDDLEYDSDDCNLALGISRIIASEETWD